MVVANYVGRKWINFREIEKMISYYKEKAETYLRPKPRYKNGAPSVTEVISFFNDASEPYFKEEHRARGVRLHKSFELYLKGKDVTARSKKIDLPYMDSFYKWADNYKHPHYLTEQRVKAEYDGMPFNGTVDYVGIDNEDKKLYLIDFKTGQSISKWWQLQTAAYLYAVPWANLFPDADAEDDYRLYRGTLRIRNTGAEPLYTEHNKYHYHLGVFKHMLFLYYSLVIRNTTEFHLLNTKPTKTDHSVMTLYFFMEDTGC